MPLTTKTKYDATVNEHHWIHQTALSTQAFLTPLIRQIIPVMAAAAELSAAVRKLPCPRILSIPCIQVARTISSYLLKTRPTQNRSTAPDNTVEIHSMTFSPQIFFVICLPEIRLPFLRFR